MVNLRQRSLKKELLDGKDIPFADIQKNMQELNTINLLLGGHAISKQGLQQLIKHKKNNHEILHVCEIGCGGGDNLMALERYCKQQDINVRFTGIDIKKECIVFAKQQYPQLNAQWVVADYADINNKNINSPDIIFASLFCHHFTDDEIISMLKWMRINATIGFFINDLHRHPFAYYSIKWITAIFSRSYLVKNDAPLSVARGFTKKEWQNIWQLANVGAINIQWKWAFRHLLIGEGE